MKLNKKSILITTFLASSVLVTAPSFADPDVIAAVQTAIAFYQKEAYQPDPNISVNAAANPRSQLGKYVAEQNSFNTTQSNIVSTLESIPISLLSTSQGANNAQYVQNKLQQEQNAKYDLTMGVPASDTLYYNDQTTLGMGYTPGMGGATLNKPTVLHDNYFNIGSVLAPTAYTQDQANAAKYFTTYLTYNYNYPNDGIKFDEVKSKLADLNNPNGRAKQYELIHKLEIDPAYQDYQLTVRSNMASESVIKSNMNYLINERTPIASLGSTPGVKAVNGKASPLQVEHYIATHRVNDPKWYAHLRVASPATVQRETLMVLAEIENQNYQAHLDRERILATLSAQQAQQIQSSQLLLKTKTQKVNEVIDNLTGNSVQNQTSDGAQGFSGKGAAQELATHNNAKP